MRTSPSKSRLLPLGVRFFGLCSLIVLLLAPTPGRATVTQASLHRENRSRRLHATSRHAQTRHISSRSARSNALPVSRRRIVRRGYATRVIRVSQSRRRGSVRARRYRLDATLERIRTHTTPTETAAANAAGDPVAPTQLDTGSPRLSQVAQPNRGLTAANSGIDTIGTAQGAADRRDQPFMNTAIPQFMPVALRGSHEVLVHQNIIADVEGLGRIQNDSQMGMMVRTGELVALPASSALGIDSRLPLNRRYCRPWTAKFLTDLSRAHESMFGHPLQLTSAVRTVEFQLHLAHYNGNAAPAYGDTASPHLTGQAIDLGKKGMSQHEVAWMRAILGQLQASGKLDVEEEFEQACFHISVYKTYAPHTAPPQRLIATEDVPTDSIQTEEAPPRTAIGGLTRPAGEPVRQRTEVRYTRSYSVRSMRYAVARRHRHHHRGMSLIAARMR